MKVESVKKAYVLELERHKNLLLRSNQEMKALRKLVKKLSNIVLKQEFTHLIKGDLSSFLEFETVKPEPESPSKFNFLDLEKMRGDMLFQMKRQDNKAA